MTLPKRGYGLLFTVFFMLAARLCFGQAVITGTVYDNTQKYTMAGVSVLSTSGAGTTTDSTGHYRLGFGSGDSIYFSYLGKQTLRFPVREINPNQPFDMALAVSIDSLPAAFVRGNNYFLDSLETRKEYARVFSFAPSYLTNMRTRARGGMGVGLDLDMFFHAKENRRMEAFQQRLLEEEKDNYIDHRFTRAMVRSVTGMQSPALDSFMVFYRPTKEFIESCESEYQFYHYVQEWAKYYAEDWNTRHPDIPAFGKEGADSVKMREAMDSVRLR